MDIENKTILEFDCLTGILTEREATSEELANWPPPKTPSVLPEGTDETPSAD
jgi:hypothetical protein